MDYYENVVIDYLRADRALFVNTECCIQIKAGRNPAKGTLWYCDAVVADFRSKAVFLCEITYAMQLAILIKRLKAWDENWNGIRAALTRDCFLLNDWPVRPWLFVPEICVLPLLTGLSQIGSGSPKFTPRITTLEPVHKLRQRNLASYRRGSGSGLASKHVSQ